MQLYLELIYYFDVQDLHRTLPRLCASLSCSGCSVLLEDVAYRSENNDHPEYLCQVGSKIVFSAKVIYLTFLGLHGWK